MATLRGLTVDQVLGLGKGEAANGTVAADGETQAPADASAASEGEEPTAAETPAG
jgi:hypothetical protein